LPKRISEIHILFRYKHVSISVHRVIGLVCPSVCPVLTIYSKSECLTNYKFIGDTMQDTSNKESHWLNPLTLTVAIWVQQL